VLRVVGAGLGRTGTLSLKLALERLLGGPCYHMAELFAHPEHVPLWHGAVRGRMPDWRELFRGYRAAVDWPVASFWPELTHAFPDALVLLSVRDPESWWRSASETIFPATRGQEGSPWRALVDDLFATRFTPDIRDRDASVAAFERHNARVRREVPRERLLEWRAREGWGPLAAALGLPAPDEPFPRVNTREQFRALHGDAQGEAERRPGLPPRVRREAQGDAASIHTLLAGAFPTDAEARLVAALRGATEPQVSLVAEGGGAEIVGHILFTPAEIRSPGEPGRAMALGPMAVRPGRQRQGVGSALVRAGLAACREAGERRVVVLGHPAYYPRFGFAPAWDFGLYYRAPGRNPAFLALELEPGALRGPGGEVRYHPAFAGL